MLRTLEAVLHERYVPPYALALVHAGLGERDAVFEWLNRAYSARRPSHLSDRRSQVGPLSRRSPIRGSSRALWLHAYGEPRRDSEDSAERRRARGANAVSPRFLRCSAADVLIWRRGSRSEFLPPPSRGWRARTTLDEAPGFSAVTSGRGPTSRVADLTNRSPLTSPPR